MIVHPDFQSSGLSSSPVRTATGVFAPDPVDRPQATGTAGAVPPPAPAPFLRPGPPEGCRTSLIRTEDGTVILFDRLTCQAVSGLTKAAAEAALQRLQGEARNPA
jgi:hypothetical protein